jgi:hypothetical protein
MPFFLTNQFLKTLASGTSSVYMTPMARLATCLPSRKKHRVQFLFAVLLPSLTPPLKKCLTVVRDQAEAIVIVKHK